jgi:hypothetical protein
LYRLTGGHPLKRRYRIRYDIPGNIQSRIKNMSQALDAMTILKIQHDHLTRFPVGIKHRDGLHTFIYQFL